MAPESAAADDVHAHVHRTQTAPTSAKPAPKGPKSVRTDATPARVIPLRPGDRQGSRRISPQESRNAASEAPLGSLRDVVAAASEEIRESGLTRTPMSVEQAASQIVPEADPNRSKFATAAMVIGGLFRLIIVSFGHTIAHAGATRIRAGVAGSVLILSLLVAVIARALA